ncbi:MAG: bifunctional lysine ketoglutarate reductase /saccharopine dehydrogenase family protein [Myxococcota bacterium]
MTLRIGIRREDKNHWERRAPLTPDHVAELVHEHRLEVIVQPSGRRAFPDRAYAAAGARLDKDLSACPIVLGVKEVPRDKLESKRAYLYFSHVIKGQPQNMPMLQRVLEQRCTLIDYELIVDKKGRRLIFFGRHAGYAGAIDSLWALGQRLEVEGFETPLSSILLAHEYDSLEEAMQSIREAGDQIRKERLPDNLHPIVVAFTGEGNVSTGAQEVFDRLPVETISPDELPALMAEPLRARRRLFKLQLPPPLTVDRVGGGDFDWDEYVQHPELYVANMNRWLEHITMLVHGIYWEPRFPRIVTREWVEQHWAKHEQPTLRVIGDIACDIEGSVEVTLEATTPGDPVYVYEPERKGIVRGVRGRGPVIMAVDNLPCELPVEASDHFGDALLRFVPLLARCDWNRPLEELALPAEIKNAIIAHDGKLAPAWQHLQAHLPPSRGKE